MCGDVYHCRFSLEFAASGPVPYFGFIPLFPMVFVVADHVGGENRWERPAEEVIPLLGGTTCGGSRPKG